MFLEFNHKQVHNALKISVSVVLVDTIVHILIYYCMNNTLKHFYIYVLKIIYVLKNICLKKIYVLKKYMF